MSPIGEFGVLFIITIILALHLGQNLMRVKKKYDFVLFLKDKMHEWKTKKDAYMKEENLVFHTMPHCVFDKDSNSFPDEEIERYGEIYELYKNNAYYVLLHFIYEEREEVIKENLEVSELTKKEKERFIEEHTFTFQKAVEREKAAWKETFEKIRNGKIIKKNTKNK